MRATERVGRLEVALREALLRERAQEATIARLEAERARLEAALQAMARVALQTLSQDTRLTLAWTELNAQEAFDEGPRKGEA